MSLNGGVHQDSFLKFKNLLKPTLLLHREEVTEAEHEDDSDSTPRGHYHFNEAYISDTNAVINFMPEEEEDEHDDNISISSTYEKNVKFSSNDSYIWTLSLFSSCWNNRSRSHCWKQNLCKTLFFDQ